MKSVYVYRNENEKIEVSFEFESGETNDEKRDCLAFEKLAEILNRSTIDDYLTDFCLDYVSEVAE
jgi:hypothetical protein